VAERIRYHLDENVDPSVAIGLRAYGIDVTISKQKNLLSSGDGTQLAYAIRENRVIVTHDEDFLIIHSHGVEHPGIVYCHLGSRSIGQMVESIRLIYEVLTPVEMRNRVEYI
jgi:predicted nuclease of predicted toxin-antitoxin system